MKYDLVVVGGGPAGLMAAKTAAEDGLKVVVIERKKNITEINRTCAQIFYIRKLTPSKGLDGTGLHGDGYIEPVSVEINDTNYRFHFPIPGFSLDYNGPLKPYFNWVVVSPSRYLIYKRKDTLWGFQLSKEAFLAELLDSAQRAGADVIPETIGISAENTADGVSVLIRQNGREQTLESNVAIAADGRGSNIVESLGLNKKRQLLSKSKMVCYELEGVETDLPPYCFASICVPSINRFMLIMMGQMTGDKTQLTSGSEEVIKTFMNRPNFAPWFRYARLVKKTGYGASTRTPIKDPVEGNVLVVGDAAAPIETWIQGAVACGYQAVKAIKKELSGQTGYSEYIDWWQKAFYFHNSDYWNYVFECFALANAWSCDEDVDCVYRLFQGKEGVPQMIIRENLELIKEERPELYEKLKNAYENAHKIVSKVGANS